MNLQSLETRQYVLSGEASSEQWLKLLADAGRIGISCSVQEAKPTQYPLVTADRDSFMAFAVDTETKPGVAKRGWYRLQELYTSKIKYEKFSLLDRQVPPSTPVIFHKSDPFPSVKIDQPQSWDGWRETLSELDVHSLDKLVLQLHNTQSRLGRNPYADILGRNNGVAMVELFEGFVASKLQA